MFEPVNDYIDRLITDTKKELKESEQEHEFERYDHGHSEGYLSALVNIKKFIDELYNAKN